MGRFINADVFVSTGQGLLGNNMFAYCLNNPSCLSDPSGCASIATPLSLKNQPMQELANDDCGGCGGIIPIPIPGFNIDNVLSFIQGFADHLYVTYQKLRDEVYRYSQELRQLLIDTRASMPQVHHIVPIGNFSKRDPIVQQQVHEMHAMLSNAGINRYIDPNNLLLVSTKTHASLHTDAYISHVYSYIIATDGSREQIYCALLLLRLEVAARDSYSVGY